MFGQLKNGRKGDQKDKKSEQKDGRIVFDVNRKLDERDLAVIKAYNEGMDVLDGILEVSFF